jgi:hypothetical protein
MTAVIEPVASSASVAVSSAGFDTLNLVAR